MHLGMHPLFFNLLLRRELFLLALCVAAHELIYTTGGVNQLRLTSVERVRRAGDFQFYQRISFAFKFDCLLCVNS